jgi:formamidopyrimidine-DNA glycosylase
MNATALHKGIDRIRVDSPEILENLPAPKLQAALKGRRFEGTDRHGKYLFVKLDDGHWLTLHFGMTGYLKYFKRMEKKPPHDRLLIRFSNGYHLAYSCQRKLGEIGLIDDTETFIRERHLGPDAMDSALDAAALQQRLSGRKGSIKSALMDQAIVAGIGNVYSDEILFQAKIPPQAKANRLNEKDLKGIFRAMKEVLDTAIACQADPEAFPDSYLLPHRAQDGRCPRCGGEIRHTRVSGRTAYFCPKCQKNR